ncbi:MAG: T9SS type A sorting domain-containing protein [Flavisolibacter sp.]|nr:T9SS type A sorting domain-containing protein [Flavisolibacter sp.]
MKQIFTLIAAFCLLFITKSLFSQSATISSTDPGVTLSTSVVVKSANNFASANQNQLGTYPKGSTTELTTPSFYYTSSVSTIYFMYNYNVATNGTSSINAPVVTIFPTGKTPITITASAVTIPGSNSDLYFTVTLSTPLPAYTSFKIKVDFNVPSGDKSVTANSIATNALLGSVTSPLPVIFNSFYVKPVNTGVALIWNVGAEQHVNGYEIQRSADGKNFTKIGFVPARHESSYSYTDITSQTGSNYYRIRSVDNDGQYKYSSVVLHKTVKSSIEMKAFPIPAKDVVTVQHATITNNSQINILSLDGKIIKAITPAAGAQQTVINLSTVNTGIYLLQFNSGNGEIETMKLIKQ